MTAEYQELLCLLESVGSKLPGAFKENVISDVVCYTSMINW